MTKYKFNIGKKELSDEQVDKHKDFKKLMHEYDSMVKPLYKRPLYKNRKVLLVVLIILLIIYILTELWEEGKKEDHNAPAKTEEKNNK